MEILETGKDKIKKISEVLKSETLAPAKQEAQKIVEQAQAESHKILNDAEKKAEQLLQEALKKIEKQKQLFAASLFQAKKQGLQGLKQAIEEKLFNESLATFVQKNLTDPVLGAKLVTAIVNALEKEGTTGDLSALVAKEIPAKEVNAHLAQEILEKLKDQGVLLGDFLAGVQIKLKDRDLTLDLSDKAIEELLARYIRKDFRGQLFQDDVN